MQFSHSINFHEEKFKDNTEFFCYTYFTKCIVCKHIRSATGMIEITLKIKHIWKHMSKMDNEHVHECQKKVHGDSITGSFKMSILK